MPEARFVLNYQTVSEEVFSEVPLSRWGCLEEEAAPGPTSSQAAITKKVPKARLPNG
jgi:hypothetical protein